MNPWRYRSYYYDTETKLYYLQTRYYDPETGRFITIDDLSYLAPDQIGGLNPYAYCGNNPVMRTDSTGMFWQEIGNWWNDNWKNVVKVAAGVAIIAGLAVGSVLTGGMLSVVLAGAAIGATAGSIGGGISGVVSGGGLQGFANGFLAGSITGAISGAIGASPLGLGLQVGINAGLGMGNYWVSSLLNGSDMTLGGFATSAIFGAIGGYLGGSGWSNGVKDLLKIDVSKNFLKVALSYAGKEWTKKAIFNSFAITGLSSGFYSKYISGVCNPNGNFIGW